MALNLTSAVAVVAGAAGWKLTAPDENGVYTVDIPTWMGMYITFDFYEA